VEPLTIISLGLEHQQELLERTPLKIPIVPEPQLPQRSITGSSHKTELNSDQLSPGFYVREKHDSGDRVSTCNTK
jgi:hypothetical protein